MVNYWCKVMVFAATLAVCAKTVLAINCYQCTGTDSKNPFQCNEFLEDYDLNPDPCDSVYGAEYCVKHVGRFEGGIGTKRFCSSKDLGNYCDYVKQPGDKLEYRSCIYTCSGDGCNASSSIKPLTILSVMIILFAIFWI